MNIRLIQWDVDAWEEYCKWQQKNKNVLKRINQLVKDIKRNPYEGIGKPEALKGNLSGFCVGRQIIFSKDGITAAK